ncbi:MAG: hypothetical protein H6581_30875 [Bacteroidia bacterium]|nr:hypothetical protein [Bacteroidia bacterium]
MNNINDLHTQILSAKTFLTRELVKIKTQVDSPYNFREINDRLDMIHEAERIGYRNLSDSKLRKITRMIGELVTSQN